MFGPAYAGDAYGRWNVDASLRRKTRSSWRRGSTTAKTTDEPLPRKTARDAWTRLLARIYEVPPLLCSICGRELGIIAFITTRAAIREILDYLGEPRLPFMGRDLQRRLEQNPGLTANLTLAILRTWALEFPSLLTTQLLHTVWMTTPHKARTSKAQSLGLEIARATGEVLTARVERILVEGGTCRSTASQKRSPIA